MFGRVALAMCLDDDPKALRAYLSGDRESELVTKYFAQHGAVWARLCAKPNALR
jgi:hypothetical protein